MSVWSSGLPHMARPEERAWTWRARAGAMLGIAALAGCGGAPDATTEPLRPVRVETVAPAGAVQTREFSGQARAADQLRLSFRVPGMVVERAVAVGDAVPAGALLIRLDERDYAVGAQEARAGLASARARERNALASYERVRGLYENGNAAKGELDAARSAADSAEAGVRLSLQQLEGARLRLSYTTLRAPDACRVLDAPVDVAEYVAPGQVVLELACGRAMEVALGVPEAVIPRVRAGAPARVRFDALPGREYAAAVAQVGVGAARSATTFPVVLALTDADAAVLPGMSAQAALELPTGSADRIVLPSAAVAEDRQGRHVYVLDRQGAGAVVRRRAVEIGDLAAEGIVVRAGVRPGDEVVVAGVSHLHDGMAVRAP